MNQSNNRIAAAVATCLKYAVIAQSPGELAADLALLLKGAGWAEADIGQIQQRVQLSLMRRRATDGNADSTCAKIMTGQSALPPGTIERRRSRSSPPAS